MDSYEQSRLDRQCTSPAYSKYTLRWLALYRSAGSACFVKCIALWGQSESWECQNRFRERRKPRPTDSYEQSCLDLSFLSAFFSTVPLMYRICMPFGGPRGSESTFVMFCIGQCYFQHLFKCGWFLVCLVLSQQRKPNIGKSLSVTCIF